jgi:predicted kinase
MDMVLLIGLQASGKSTFCRERFAQTHDVISKDLFPNARNPQTRQMRMVRESLAAGRSTVIDNTNATRESRRALIETARAQGVKVIGYYFESRVKECLDRNRTREGRSRVPDVALYSTIKVLEAPAYAEGFDELFHVKIAEEGRFVVSEWIDEEP